MIRRLKAMDKVDRQIPPSDEEIEQMLRDQEKEWEDELVRRAEEEAEAREAYENGPEETGDYRIYYERDGY
jgi:hypothetical protein